MEFEAGFAFGRFGDLKNHFDTALDVELRKNFDNVRLWSKTVIATKYSAHVLDDREGGVGQFDRFSDSRRRHPK